MASFSQPEERTKALPLATPTILTSWTQATSAPALALLVESLFPRVDMWRLAFLDPVVSSYRPYLQKLSRHLTVHTKDLETMSSLSYAWHR